jgi:hypothetical protein
MKHLYAVADPEISDEKGGGGGGGSGPPAPPSKFAIGNYMDWAMEVLDSANNVYIFIICIFFPFLFFFISLFE